VSGATVLRDEIAQRARTNRRARRGAFSAAVSAIVTAVPISESDAEQIVQAVARGEIPNLTINYRGEA
jgi:hypothetical protein